MGSKRQLVVFLTFVVGIVLLLTLIFRHNPGGSKTDPKIPKAFVLTDYITKDSEVSMVEDGRINGDDVHRSIRITVNRNMRTLEVIQGYQGKVITTQSYPNNQEAYDAFMHALAKTGFGKSRKAAISNVDGVCANGRRYLYNVTESGDPISYTWTADCQKGTSPVLIGNVTSLFRRQITDYDRIANRVDL